MDSNNKTIRFIDSEYRELFCIPDGCSIKVTYPPGDGRAPITRACKFLDEVHFQTLGSGGDSYHINQFAEIMERIGATYEPLVQLRDAEVVPFAPGEEKYCTYNREDGNTCVGHLAGEFGQQGDRFFSSWYNHRTKSEADSSLLLSERLYPLCREVDSAAKHRLATNSDRAAAHEIILAELVYK